MRTRLSCNESIDSGHRKQELFIVVIEAPAPLEAFQYSLQGSENPPLLGGYFGVIVTVVSIWPRACLDTRRSYRLGLIGDM